MNRHQPKASGSRDADATRRAPLDGIVVADFSRVLAGPYATMLLGDLGAEVVKVERPGDGDDARLWGPPFADGDSTYYLSVNRNKRSLTLDLNDPEDLDRARELAARADVLIENFRPGTIERLGLGYDDLVDANPGLVYCSISGLGREKGSALQAYDFLIQAAGGLMSITGDPSGEPMKVGLAIVDVLTGMFATIGIVTALNERGRSGQGQRVDVNLLSSLLAVLVNQASAYLNADQVPSRLGNDHPSLAPYQLVTTADEPIVVAAGNSRQFTALCELIGHPDLVSDERFQSNASRVANRDALRELINDIFERRPAAEWIRACNDVGVPAGPVNDIRGAFELAAELGLPTTVDIPRADGRPVTQVVNPLTFSRTPVRYDLAPPRLGEHNTELRDQLDGPSPT